MFHEQEDYETLYNAVLSRLDEKDALLTRAEITERKLCEDHDMLRKRLADSTAAQTQLQSQISALQDGFNSSMQAIKACPPCYQNC